MGRSLSTHVRTMRQLIALPFRGEQGERDPRVLPAALLLAALCALSTVAVALAHAAYDHSTPGQGEVVQAAPARVDIFTKENMQKTQGVYFIQVQHADAALAGAQVDMADTTIDDANRMHFYVDLQPNLGPGRYLVSFNNVSDDDGEADHGQFAFYVQSQPTAAQKALDAKLQITTAKADTTTSSSHTGLIITIVVIAVVVLAALSIGAFLLQRRRRTA